jgi:hypothetical protein
LALRSLRDTLLPKFLATLLAFMRP